MRWCEEYKRAARLRFFGQFLNTKESLGLCPQSPNSDSSAHTNSSSSTAKLPQIPISENQRELLKLPFLFYSWSLWNCGPLPSFLWASRIYCMTLSRFHVWAQVLREATWEQPCPPQAAAGPHEAPSNSPGDRVRAALETFFFFNKNVSDVTGWPDMGIRLQWLPGAPSETARLRHKETCFLPAENEIGPDQTDKIQKRVSAWQSQTSPVSEAWMVSRVSLLLYLLRWRGSLIQKMLDDCPRKAFRNHSELHWKAYYGGNRREEATREKYVRF